MEGGEEGGGGVDVEGEAAAHAPEGDAAEGEAVLGEGGGGERGGGGEEGDGEGVSEGGRWWSRAVGWRGGR